MGSPRYWNLRTPACWLKRMPGESLLILAALLLCLDKPPAPSLVEFVTHAACAHVAREQGLEPATAESLMQVLIQASLTHQEQDRLAAVDQLGQQVEEHVQVVTVHRAEAFNG